MEIEMNNAAAVMNAVSGTQVAVRTEAKPIAWQGIQGCKNFSSPVTIKEAIDAVGANYQVERNILSASQTLCSTLLWKVCRQ